MTGPFGTTPAPWPVSAYDEHAGYDCMTGGIEIGRHITLDAGRYGQAVSWESDDESKFDMARLVADAKALGQVPAMLELVTYIAAMAGKGGKYETGPLPNFVEDACKIAAELEVK